MSERLEYPQLDVAYRRGWEAGHTAALAEHEAEVKRLREAVEFAGREFRRLGRENSARQMEEALAPEDTH
jgi:hypothetical protein